MTSWAPDQPTAPAGAGDQQMADALLRDLTCALDLEAGLHDALSHARSDRLLRHLSHVLDLDSGLRAILPPDLAQPRTAQTTHFPPDLDVSGGPSDSDEPVTSGAASRVRPSRSSTGVHTEIAFCAATTPDIPVRVAWSEHAAGPPPAVRFTPPVPPGRIPPPTARPAGPAGPAMFRPATPTSPATRPVRATARPAAPAFTPPAPPAEAPGGWRRASAHTPALVLFRPPLTGRLLGPRGAAAGTRIERDGTRSSAPQPAASYPVDRQ